MPSLAGWISRSPRGISTSFSLICTVYSFVFASYRRMLPWPCGVDTTVPVAYCTPLFSYPSRVPHTPTISAESMKLGVSLKNWITSSCSTDRQLT